MAEQRQRLCREDARMRIRRPFDVKGSIKKGDGKESEWSTYRVPSGCAVERR